MTEETQVQLRPSTDIDGAHIHQREYVFELCRAKMTEDERQAADLIASNFKDWTKEFLGIEVELPQNATAPDVQRLKNTDEVSTPGLTYRSHIEISYDPATEGIQKFIYLQTHELFHFAGKRDYAVHPTTGGYSQNPIRAGFFSGSPLYDAESHELLITNRNGHMLNEAVTDMAFLHQWNFLRQRQPEQNYGDRANPAFLYDMVFWDTVFENMAQKSGIPYSELLKQIFKNALYANSLDPQLDGFCNAATKEELILRAPYSLDVGDNFIDSLQKVDDDDVEDEVLERILADTKLLKNLGLEEKFLTRLEVFLESGSITLMDDVTISLDDTTKNGLSQPLERYKTIRKLVYKGPRSNHDEDDSWMQA